MFFRMPFRFCRPCFLLLICLAAGWTGCNSKELTRSRAADLIKSSEEFKKGVSITLLSEYRQSLTLIGTGSREMSKEDFALRRFLESHADLAVLNHLGLIDFKVSKIEFPDSAASPVVINSSLTDKGREAAKEWQQQGNGWTIPTAKKEMVEVTGLTGDDKDSKEARAEYTWKWQPTEIGANFDTSSQAYNGLPDSIKQNFGGASVADMMGNAGRIVTFDSSKQQKGTAKLQLYDDGWRVTGNK